MFASCFPSCSKFNDTTRTSSTITHYEYCRSHAQPCRQEDDEQLARRLQEEVEAQMWGVCSTWGDGPFMDDIPMKNADLMGFLWFSGKWHIYIYR